MSEVTALYDSCVLYPAPLRDLLVHLGASGLVHAKWTQRIHDEWMDALLINRPDLSRDRLLRTRDLMDRAVLNCLVEGYEPLAASLVLPDPNDCHVLAAAVHCGADAIVTLNLKHFPQVALVPYGIEALHPDDFLIELMDDDLERVCIAARKQRLNLKNPPKSVAEFLAGLTAQGLHQSVARLQSRADLLE